MERGEVMRSKLFDNTFAFLTNTPGLAQSSPFEMLRKGVNQSDEHEQRQLLNLDFEVLARLHACEKCISHDRSTSRWTNVPTYVPTQLQTRTSMIH
jgi:hypothetical protein